MNFNIKKMLLSIMVVLSVIILIIAGYLIHRHNYLQKNNLLISFELLTPVKKDLSKIGESGYEAYIYGKNIGRVIYENYNNELKRMTLKDEKNGYIRTYIGNVLLDEYDYEKAELLAEIRSYLNPEFWVGGCRIISTKGEVKQIRTMEECLYLNELLFEEKFDMIKKKKSNQLIKSKNGKYYVN